MFGGPTKATKRRSARQRGERRSLRSSTGLSGDEVLAELRNRELRSRVVMVTAVKPAVAGRVVRKKASCTRGISDLSVMVYMLCVLDSPCFTQNAYV
ncbi:hypothetical protein ACFFQF_26345 [Haladaptatus pallidirubidus]|uniref:hypothetical protein n=1 Tax=Haladaptatus pallidirubidus TaxID=1008152 RepID=UPI0035E92D01